jgi:hypothetical protein
MGWTRKPRRITRQHLCRDVEHLELRQLLSQASAITGPVSLTPVPQPAAAATLTNTSGTDYTAITGAAQARAQYGVDGTGSTVAVIDTGVDYNDTALGGGFGPGYKVVAGYDFGDNNSDPNAKTWQHGTAVAGLIASTDPANLGIAPGADIVSLKVFNDSNVGSYNNVAAALQWVITNHSTYNITAVNISLADGNNYTQNWFATDGGVGEQITNLIAQLDSLNIPVISATGNSFSGQQGEGFTAIVPDTISVTASDASDQIVADAQRLGAAVGGASVTDVAAPGAGLTVLSNNNQLSSGDGTSFATPIVSGAVVLLQQIYESRFGTLPTVSQLTSWIQQGSDPIYDPVTGLTIGRLDIPKAAALIPNPAAQFLAPPSTPAPSSNTVTAPPPTVTAPTPPVVVTPPPVVVTPPPAAPPVNTPAPTPPQQSSPPAQSAPPASAPVQTDDNASGDTQVVVNGQQVDGSGTTSSGSSVLSSLSAVFANVLRSFSSWNWGSSTPTSAAGAAPTKKLTIWTANSVTSSPGQALPMGTLTPLFHVSTDTGVPQGPSGHHRQAFVHHVARR